MPPLVLDISVKDTLGPFALTRRLPSCRIGERFVALHQVSLTSHVVYRFNSGIDGRDALAALEAACVLQHRHILKIEHFDLDKSGRPFCVTPFTGDRDGLLSLTRLLRAKSGIMRLAEAKHAADQLLAAIAYAHMQRAWHGPMMMDEVLIDRHGALHVELYGVANTLGHPENDPAEQQRREVQTAMGMLYQLITGLRYEEPFIRPGRVIAGLHRSWDDFFETGLSEPGFASGAHARSALLACRTEPTGRMLSPTRLRAAMQRAMWAGQ